MPRVTEVRRLPMHLRIRRQEPRTRSQHRCTEILLLRALRILRVALRVELKNQVLHFAVLNSLLFLKHADFLSAQVSSGILSRFRLRRKSTPASGSRALVYTGAALPGRAAGTQIGASIVEVCASYEGWICICLVCFFFWSAGL